MTESKQTGVIEGNNQWSVPEDEAAIQNFLFENGFQDSYDAETGSLPNVARKISDVLKTAGLKETDIIVLFQQTK